SLVLNEYERLLRQRLEVMDNLTGLVARFGVEEFVQRSGCERARVLWSGCNDRPGDCWDPRLRLGCDECRSRVQAISSQRARGRPDHTHYGASSRAWSARPY